MLDYDLLRAIVYRVYLTGIHALRTGEIESSLPRLLDHHPLEGVEELIERKKAGAEKDALPDDEIASHRSRLDALEGELEAAFESSPLPAKPTSFDALDDFLVRARLALGSAA